MSRRRKKRTQISHLYAKLLIAHCVLWGTLLSLYALNVLDRTGQDGSGLLAIVLGFLGGELLLMCLRTVLNEKKSSGGDDPPEGKE